MSSDYTPIIDEYCLPISPAMVAAFGYSGAMFLSQVHGWLQTAERKGDQFKYENGQWWTWNSYAEWTEHLYCMDVRTIKRTVSKLEKQKVLLSRKPDKHKGNHCKWYSIDYDKFNELVAEVRQEARPVGSEGGDKVSLEGGDTMPQASDTMTPVSGDTMPQGGDKVSLSYIEPNNSPNNGSNNHLEGESEGEIENSQDGRKNRGERYTKPSEYQSEYAAAVALFEPPLGEAMERFVSIESTRRNKGGYLSGKTKWEQFAQPLSDALREGLSVAELCDGIEVAIENGGHTGNYAVQVARNKREEAKRAPNPGRGAPKARRHGENSPAAAARRSDGYEWFFEDKSPKQGRSREAQDLYDSGSQSQRDAIKFIDGMHLPPDEYADALEGIKEMED